MTGELSVHRRMLQGCSPPQRCLRIKDCEFGKSTILQPPTVTDHHHDNTHPFAFCMPGIYNWAPTLKQQDVEPPFSREKKKTPSKLHNSGAQARIITASG